MRYAREDMASIRRILISGATGFIGSVLVPKLAANFGNEILTINRDITKAEQKFGIYKNVRYAESDDWEIVKAFNPEIVIHLAGLSTANENQELIKELVDSNITYGVLLLNALSKCDAFKFFVNTGSFSEYRHGPERIDCAYLYSATKAAFQNFVDYYSDKFGFKSVTAVLYSVYGGDRTVKRVMDYIAESVDAENPIDMTAGAQILDFIHVDDVADFYCKLIYNCAKLDKINRYIHVGTGNGIRIKDIALMIESICGSKCNINWGGIPYRARDIMCAVAPPCEELDLIDWSPRKTLEATLQHKYGKSNDY